LTPDIVTALSSSPPCPPLPSPVGAVQPPAFFSAKTAVVDPTPLLPSVRPSVRPSHAFVVVVVVVVVIVVVVIVVVVVVIRKK
jgi:hypothetical protein